MRKFRLIGSACAVIILFLVPVLFNPGCCPCSRTQIEPANASSTIRSPLVVSFHELAEKSGYRILQSGGNAFDAYVAVTMVENVVSSGYVSFAGLLSTLTYHAGEDQVLYLDSGYNSVLNPDGAFDQNNPVAGKKIEVPGIIAGLESISKRFGKLNFADTLQPAIEIARDGFAIDELFARHIESNSQKLQSTAYGQQTFFNDGRALRPGDTLKQPELAEFLTNLAEQGAKYMYSGEWATRLVQTAQEKGGLMTREDLVSYQPIWTQPWNMTYRNFELYASSGRANLSLWVLLALKTLEHTNIQLQGHFSASADALETMVRVARAVDEEDWIHDYHNLDDRDLVNSRLTLNYSAGIWARANGALKNIQQNFPLMSHTLSTIIADTSGNVISGKHSINSELWGDGFFIQGVVLNASGDTTERYTGPGQRRIQGAPNFLVFENQALRFALGTFSSSNPHAAFQFLVNLLDYRLPADQAAELPRFGSFPYDMDTWTVDSSKNWLDERVSQEIVEILKTRGLQFSQKRPKLGKGCIAELHPDGQVTVGWDKID